jgi:DNA-3-methyladenine glycosylase II
MHARRPTPPRLIDSEADLADGIRALRRKCSVVRLMHDRTGLPPLRRQPGGLEGLARIIVGQQVSVASAAAIWARTRAAIAPFDAPALLAASDETCRAAGLSAAKVRTLRAIARAIVEDGLDLARLGGLAEAEVRDRLTAITGIGPWTADIYIMFCLGRADGFAPGDLALQVALQMAAGLEQRPSPGELAAFAERWRPWRGVAARLLWAYYTIEKNARSGAPL